MSTRSASIEGSSSLVEPWVDLNDKVVLVTGASSGLGWNLCLDLAKAGCRIIAAARRTDRLKSLCDQINNVSSTAHQIPSVKPSQDHRAAALELDVSASESIIEACVKEAWSVFGRIDALINNAGVRGRIHGPLDLTEEEWNNIIRTNQTGTYLMSKHVSAHMRDSKRGGSIINISSISGLDRVQFHGGHAYAASKFAVSSITKVMALELGKFNIRVNLIAPGIFESEISDGFVKKGWYNKLMTNVLPLISAESIVPGLTSLARYLLHDDSQYITGNVFIVDGGLTLRGMPRYALMKPGYSSL